MKKMLEDKIIISSESPDTYTHPKELIIAGIPAVVVDPHNEVIPYWHAFREKNKEPAVLLHIDAHSDMGECAQIYSLLNNSPGTGNFIIFLEDAIKDFKPYSGPLILDIDLDAFECINDPKEDRAGINRIGKTFALLRELPTPGLVTIARSQNTSSHNLSEFTPYYRVDFLERIVIKGIERIYRKKISY